MKINHQDTALRSIAERDLDRIRNWRNDPSINKYLINRAYISPEEQLQWFKSLDPSDSIYFIAEQKSIPFGIVYGVSVDRVAKTFEGNILIGEPDYRDTLLPVKIIMMLSDLFFNKLNYNYSFSKVDRSNAAALAIDKRLGFEVLRTEGDLIYTRCSRESYVRHFEKLKKAVFDNEELVYLSEAGDEGYLFL